MTVKEIKSLLRDYYDIPDKIAEEFATIRNCEIEKNKITLPSVNPSGLPGGKGLSSDRTANMAIADYHKYYNNEIANCYKRIDILRDKKNWLGVALNKLDKTDRYILELAYMGDPKNRKQACRRRPTWKEIAEKIDYSESRVKQRARVALLKLTMLSNQVVFPGMIR